MAAECAVIGSNTAPVSEVIEHGKNGLLVDFFSPSEIADAVDEIISNVEDTNNLKNEARKTILDKYSTHAGIRKYLEILNIDY